MDQSVCAAAEGVVIAARSRDGLAARFAARCAAGPSLLRSRTCAGWCVFGAAPDKKITTCAGAGWIEFRTQNAYTPTTLVPGAQSRGNILHADSGIPIAAGASLTFVGDAVRVRVLTGAGVDIAFIGDPVEVAIEARAVGDLALIDDSVGVAIRTNRITRAISDVTFIRD